MVLTVLGMVAKMELCFIRDRQRAEIDAAKAIRGSESSRRSMNGPGSRRHVTGPTPSEDLQWRTARGLLS
jgi:DNA invertase Pin-like site-specific DNA recombinase